MNADVFLTVTIHGLGSGGEGVARHEGYTIYVDGALPGEVVKVRLYEKHKRYGKASVETIITPSFHRVKPPCPLFGRCGGCQLMHLSYPQQLEAKRQKVVDAITRIGKIDNVEILPCLPSPSPLGYRNKIQLPAKQGDQGIELGLYARASHNLIEVDHCAIHCALGEEVYSAVKRIVKGVGIIAYDAITGEGELRHVLIKCAVRQHEALVVLVTVGEASPALQQAAHEIIAQCPSVKGVVHNIHRGRDNVILGPVYGTLAGARHIHERLGGVLFKVSPASFFQVNADQAEYLYAKAMELAALNGDETILDAYCGVGTLSLFFASKVKQVIGVESVQEAIDDANENARHNGIGNALFFCAPAEVFIGTQSAVDIILLNPPRKGCDPAFLEGIGRLRPSKIIYISCDPATLARDLAHLHLFGYRIELIQPYDMFPQTAHVECIAKLSGI